MFAATGLLLIALLAGLIGTATGLIEARRQTEIAEDNLTTAEENYELARQSADQFFVEISENRLLNEPHMAELRRELLQSAREFFQEFVKRRGDDPEAWLDLANAHNKLATISEQMGDQQQAKFEIDACRELATKILAANDSSEAHLLMLSCNIAEARWQYNVGEYASVVELLNTAWNDLHAKDSKLTNDPQIQYALTTVSRMRADAHLDLDQQALAEEQYLLNIEMLERLAEEYPDYADYRRDIAHSLTTLATMLSRQDRFQEARDHFERSVEISRVLFDDDPNSVDVQLGLSESLMALAGYFRRAGPNELALELATEGVGIGRQLIEDHPELVSLQKNLAGYLNVLSIIYGIEERTEESDSVNQESMDLIAQLMQRFPDDIHYPLQLGALQGNRGNTELGRQAWLEAVDWYDRANASLQIRLDKSPQDPQARIIIRNNHWGRADAFLALQQHDNAIQAYNDAIEFALPSAHPQIQLDKAKAQIDKGDYSAAVELVHTLKPDLTMEFLNRESNYALIWFMTGQVLMMAANSADEDLELDGPSRASIVERLHGEVMDCLEEAVAFNHFKDKQSAPLKSELFAPLGDDPRFQQIVARADEPPEAMDNHSNED